MGRQKTLSNTELQRTLDAVVLHEGNTKLAAEALNMGRRTVQDHVKLARDAGLTSKIPKGVKGSLPLPRTSAKALMAGITSSKPLHPHRELSVKEIEAMLAQAKKEEEKKLTARLEENEALAFKHKIKTLETQLTAYKKEELNTKFIRTKILGLAAQTPNVPAWVVDPRKAKKNSPGVPTLFASDWHWGETIDPGQVGGVNDFDLTIAHNRARELITTTIDLLNNHMVNPNYPGIIFALGGDMISGNIHDELKATNQIEVLPCVVDLVGALTWCIETLADHFGKVFVPCVSGNHGRNTHKIQMKERNHTNFDWLVYVMLEKQFRNDPRVSFMIPEGIDAYYKVYNHRYLLTHGDQLGRGGDGIIGAIGTIIRGDHRKRSRNTQIDMGYDTLLAAHFHQYISMQRVIVNGSLCGYNEYAYACNFPFEIPRQALWITHPDHGITFSMPVNVEKPVRRAKAPWVSVK